MNNTTKQYPTIGGKYIARQARGNPTALIWTVRGVTTLGVYITKDRHQPGFPDGHLLDVADFVREYVEASSA